VLVAVHAAVHLLAPQALGAGDVKLAGPLGAVLGAASPAALLAGPLLAALLTALAGALGMACGRLRRNDPLPHGPAMLVAALVLVHLR
jgi:leader peptidase (prepilin peptidase)/N-methyltransferase